MVYCSCKTLFSIRAVAKAASLAASEDLNFLQKTLPLIPLSTRYYISTNAADKHSFTVSYLINSCGLSPEYALSISKRVQFGTPEKPDSVISFLKKHGFSQPQIINLLERRPKLFSADVEKNLAPKFEFFYSKRIYRFTPCKTFVITTHKDQSLLVSNLRLLQEYGVPESYAATVFIQQPLIFIVKHDRFKAAVEEVKKMGFDPLKYAFLEAVHAFIIRGKSLWERKFSLYKKWGWSDEEIWSAFRKIPRVMLISEHNINATMDFYINKMGYKSQYFANRPILLLSSLEKRIIPRCSVLQYLLSKGLIKEDYDVRRVLQCTEKQFLQKFLNPFEDPHLLKLYEEKLCRSK
ncbi:hypothetical protein REPUB_Repub20aG0122900 [Reevesia pubescens]